MIALIVFGLIPFGIWVYLLAGRGMFWLAKERDDLGIVPEPVNWPAVVAVVPARNEADVIAKAIGGLAAQDYPGPFRIVLVDDQSDDGTAEIARTAAAQFGAKFGSAERLEVITGRPLPAGWVGKMWAVDQGVARASVDAPDYLWLTDADIGHAPDNLRHLVCRAEAGRLSLVSLMVRLKCETWADRMMIPAFVFFFDMLFPFRWVNTPSRRISAGAGGCMLVRRTSLEAAGGIASIKSAIIDDCALAARLKAQGPIWLGLTLRAESLRAYGSMGEIGRMVSRSAFAQLNYSVLLLAGTLVGMVLTYLAPPIAAVFGTGALRGFGVVTWLMMAISFQPVLKLYKASRWWGLALPAIGLLYTVFTVQSAVQVWSGRGGMWKGRAQALAGVDS